MNNPHHRCGLWVVEPACDRHPFDFPCGQVNRFHPHGQALINDLTDGDQSTVREHARLVGQAVEFIHDQHINAQLVPGDRIRAVLRHIGFVHQFCFEAFDRLLYLFARSLVVPFVSL